MRASRACNYIQSPICLFVGWFLFLLFFYLYYRHHSGPDRIRPRVTPTTLQHSNLSPAVRFTTPNIPLSLLLHAYHIKFTFLMLPARHSTARLIISVQGQQLCSLGTNHLPLTRMKLFSAKDRDFLRNSARPCNEIPRGQHGHHKSHQVLIQVQNFYFLPHAALEAPLRHSSVRSPLLRRREQVTHG